ncbi:MAG: 30S ribosomal protein S9 [Phycisphaerae bacterium]|nr:30S ribosomal protein S9 [Phycisphaerae bacterium]
MKSGFYWGTGRRKTAVARVRMRPGDGKFLVNKREVNAYFSEERDRNDVVAPLKATGTLGKFDIYANVKGGGPTGQAGAVLLGVARALRNVDPTLEHALREGGFLTRDSRMVERKKYGQSGARRRFQFSKR